MLHHVTLHLARSKQFPEGSPRYGYDITAPFDEGGHLDQEEWSDKRAYCRVRRFWADEGERQGVLVHRPGGAGGATWMIDYNRDRPGDEEAGYHLHQHRFAEGEYVTIEDDDGGAVHISGRLSDAGGAWRCRRASVMKPLMLFCLVLTTISTAAVAQSGRVQRGLTFAQTNCSQCHAIGRIGESPIPEAPPFRTLHTRYPIEDLAEAFAEGITTGHPSMPQFQLDPAQINDLLAYLNSIQG